MEHSHWAHICESTYISRTFQDNNADNFYNVELQFVVIKFHRVNLKERMLLEEEVMRGSKFKVELLFDNLCRLRCELIRQDSWKSIFSRANIEDKPTSDTIECMANYRNN